MSAAWGPSVLRYH